jgi:diguanylate cyclase (GGDEF)-like protein/PAS domain S-box-containing protein
VDAEVRGSARAPRARMQPAAGRAPKAIAVLLMRLIGALLGKCRLGAAAIRSMLRFVRGRIRIAHYRAVFQQSPHGLLMAHADTFQILDANPAMQQSVGYSLAELRALTLPQLLVDERTDDEAHCERLRQPDPRIPLQLVQRCRDGTALNVEVVGHRLELAGQALLAFTVSDVTVKRQAEQLQRKKQQQLSHLAHHDPLTGLPNRLYLAQFLPPAIEEARQGSSMLAVLFLDLDRFKHVNDSHGHEAGDHLLQEVARRVQAVVRKDDIVVRMGGDEFIVVLQSLKDCELISVMASRINEALRAPIVVDGHRLVTTASIGVGLFPRDGNDMGELLRHSDTAMYQAKESGRNNFKLFSPAMARRLRERVAVEAALRLALERGQLHVHYQPIVEITSHRITGLEALLRWQHPTQGFVLPGRFIEVAEETGLIVPIGDLVLQRVLDDLSYWRREGGQLVPVAVNISAVQLQRSNLYEKIDTLTRKQGVNPGLLQLELTESAMFERRESRNPHDGLDPISQLRALGVAIAIDDFGTGFSSFGSLKRWQLDYLKIDRTFVRDLVRELSDLAIVGAIIAMARHLNIKTVAEGIEGWQQLEKLRELGCTHAQGFLFARPASAPQCLKLLTGRPLSLTDGAARALRDDALIDLAG